MKTSKKLFERVNPFLLWWVFLLIVLIGVGVFGAWQYVGRSEAASIPWGLLVPSYVFFALAATGSSLVNSMFAVFRVQRFKPIIKRGVLLSLMLIIPAAIFIILDLGRSYQAFNLYLLFHPSSRLAWMGVLYLIFGLSLLVELIVVIREERMSKWAPLLIGIIVLVATLIVHTNLGALFGSVTAKPLWSSHLLPLHFIVSALMIGATLHILFISTAYLFKTGSVPKELRQLFSRDYRPMVIWLILINFALIAAKFIPGIFSPVASSYVKLLLAGPYSLLFWGLEILVGGIVPLIILLYRKTRGSTRWLLSASALVVIGVYFSKYDLLIAGQSIGPTWSFIPYFPEVGEILLVAGGVAVCLLLYTLGELLLPLEPEEKPVWFVFTKRWPRRFQKSNALSRIFGGQTDDKSL